MNIEQELIEFVRHTSRSSPERERNVELAAFFYGFRGNKWPTDDETGAAAKDKAIDGKRVPQIINWFFKGKPERIEKIPSAVAIASLLKERGPVSTIGFLGVLQKEGLIGDKSSAPRLLKLLNDLNLCPEFELFTHNLEPVTRGIFRNGGEFFFSTRDSIAELRPGLEELLGAPGSVGIANFKSFEEKFPPRRAAVLKEILMGFSAKWTLTTHENDLWFLFEDRTNTLFNDLKKIHTVVGSSSIPVFELRDCLMNALDARGDREDEFPREEVIEAYLRESNFLSVDSDKAVFKSTFPKDLLTITEEAAFRFLSEVTNGRSESPQLREYLRGKANAENVINHSPFIHVNKTRRNHHIFRLIGSDLNRQSDEFRQILDAAPTERTELMKSRIGQGRFRQSLIKLRRRCYVSQIADERFLRASHIVPWSDATNDERLNPNNGLLLSPNYDHLFDKAYISFEDDGRLLVSNNIPAEIREKFGIGNKLVEAFVGADLGAETKAFMALHRKRFHERSEVRQPNEE